MGLLQDACIFGVDIDPLCSAGRTAQVLQLRQQDRSPVGALLSAEFVNANGGRQQSHGKLAFVPVLFDEINDLGSSFGWATGIAIFRHHTKLFDDLVVAEVQAVNEASRQDRIEYRIVFGRLVSTKNKSRCRLEARWQVIGQLTAVVGFYAIWLAVQR